MNDLIPSQIQAWLPLLGGAGTFIFLLTIIRGFQKDFIATQQQRLLQLGVEIDGLRARVTTLQTELETVRDEQRLWTDAAHHLRRNSPADAIIPGWIQKLMEGIE